MPFDYKKLHNRIAEIGETLQELGEEIKREMMTVGCGGDMQAPDEYPLGDTEEEAEENNEISASKMNKAGYDKDKERSKALLIARLKRGRK